MENLMEWDSLIAIIKECYKENNTIRFKKLYDSLNHMDKRVTYDAVLEYLHPTTLIEELEDEAQEWIRGGNSKEISYGKGMLYILDKLKEKRS